jgi:hypothetical protein
VEHPARQAEPGTEISFTDSTGVPRVVKADAHGRVVVHDEEEAAQTADLPLFRDKPAAPAKED